MKAPMMRERPQPAPVNAQPHDPKHCYGTCWNGQCPNCERKTATAVPTPTVMQ